MQGFTPPLALPAVVNRTAHPVLLALVPAAALTSTCRSRNGSSKVGSRIADDFMNHVERMLWYGSCLGGRATILLSRRAAPASLAWWTCTCGPQDREHPVSTFDARFAR